jgi:hypothetical protein
MKFLASLTGFAKSLLSIVRAAPPSLGVIEGGKARRFNAVKGDLAPSLGNTRDTVQELLYIAALK